MARLDEVDLELIAAFIDGRLSGEERERAVRLLSESEAAFEVYSDALRARADLTGADVVPIVVARDRRRAVPWRTFGSVAAAAVVLIAVVPMMQARRDRAVLDATSAELVGPWIGSPAAATTLVGDWDRRGWTVTRGVGGRAVDTTVAFRLGVRSVHLQAALSRRDTSRAHGTARAILQSLDAVELSDAVKLDYRALREGLERGEPSDRLLADAARAEEELDELLQSFWFDFGRWAGAGELAARVRSEAFFENAKTTRFLELAAAREGLSANDAALLREIGDVAEDGVREEEFETIRQRFTTLIDRHGGG